jgi:hypothetical protein
MFPIWSMGLIGRVPFNERTVPIWSIFYQASITLDFDFILPLSTHNMAARVLSPLVTKNAISIMEVMYDAMEQIYLQVPEDYPYARENQVLLPNIGGVSHVKNRTLFGRKRWWEQRGNAIQYYIKPTAPAHVQEWQNQEEPQFFHQLLKKMYPAPLVKRLGSNLAALQLVIDVIDHLMLYRVIPLSSLSSTIIAHLTSATLLLSWPCEFLESGMSIHKWRNESADQALTEMPRQRMLLKYWERCVTSSSVSLELTCHLRTQMLFLLENLILDPPPPSLPRVVKETAPISASDVDTAGPLEEENPAPAPAQPSLVKVSVFLNKRKAYEPLVTAVLKKSP